MSEQQLDLLTYAQAMQRKDAALEQVGDNAGDWMGIALIELEGMLHSFPATFTGEFIRIKLTPWVGRPHSPNAWGALVKVSTSRKLIEPTGEWSAMRSERSHGRRTMVYRVRMRQ